MPRHADPIHPTRPGLAAVAAFALLLALPVQASRVVERPGVGYTPAFVCVATTVTPEGHTKQSSLLRRSGSAAADRNALRFVRTLRFRPPGDREQALQVVADRTSHVLVRMHQNGQMAFKLFGPLDPLPPICYAEFESVARDREINANTESLP